MSHGRPVMRGGQRAFVAAVLRVFGLIAQIEIPVAAIGLFAIVEIRPKLVIVQPGKLIGRRDGDAVDDGAALSDADVLAREAGDSLDDPRAIVRRGTAGAPNVAAGGGGR